jgi:hypothetical protein
MGIRTVLLRLALFGLALPAFPQSAFTVTPSLISGIRVYGPETREFASQLADQRIDLKLSSAGAWVPRSIVTNVSDRHVAGFLVSLEYPNHGALTSAEKSV